MNKQHEPYELDLEDDPRAGWPGGHPAPSIPFTREQKQAAHQQSMDARRAVDRWHEEQQILKDLQNADLFHSWNKSELLGHLR